MNRREFLKTCAALGASLAVPLVDAARGIKVELGRPSALVMDNLGLTVVSDTHFAPRPGRIYFVPGDADTIAEALELCSRDQMLRTVEDGGCGVIRDVKWTAANGSGRALGE